MCKEDRHDWPNSSIKTEAYGVERQQLYQNFVLKLVSLRMMETVDKHGKVTIYVKFPDLNKIAYSRSAGVFGRR